MTLSTGIHDGMPFGSLFSQGYSYLLCCQAWSFVHFHLFNPTNNTQSNNMIIFFKKASSPVHHIITLPDLNHLTPSWFRARPQKIQGTQISILGLVAAKSTTIKGAGTKVLVHNWRRLNANKTVPNADRTVCLAIFLAGKIGTVEEYLTSSAALFICFDVCLS